MMEEVLVGLGFTPKEVHIYKYVLENGAQTAAAVAKGCGEKRANTYVLLDSLVERQVVVASDAQAVRTFAAAHPSSLQRLVQAEQERQKQLAAALGAIMPKLTSRYTLASDKPGVVHMQGTDGFMTLLQDMTRSSTEVLLVASNMVPSDLEVLKDFRKLLIKRKQARVRTRAIFHHSPKDAATSRIFAERGIDLRFLGHTEFTGEVAVYENNVAFTVYEPSLVVTIISNPAIAATTRTMFEQLWDKAEQ